MILSNKGQITLPVAHRRALGLEPGDELEAFTDDMGRLIILKLERGAASGILRDLAIQGHEPPSEYDELTEGLSHP